MKKTLFKIYCWFEWFDIGTYSSPPWSTFMLIGNTILSVIILFCFLCVLIIKPSKEVFTGLLIEKIIVILWLLMVWIMPIATSVIMKKRIPYNKMIQSAEYIQIEKKCRTLGARNHFFFGYCCI